MKKALALILCLIMVATIAISTVSADEITPIDARELAAYGQYHFWLGAPAEGTAIPDVTDGKVSEGEYVIFLDSDDMLLPGALQQLSSKCGGLRENLPENRSENLPENLPDMIIYDFLKISDNAGNAINSDSFSSRMYPY